MTDTARSTRLGGHHEAVDPQPAVNSLAASLEVQGNREANQLLQSGFIQRIASRRSIARPTFPFRLEFKDLQGVGQRRSFANVSFTTCLYVSRVYTMRHETTPAFPATSTPRRSQRLPQARACAPAPALPAPVTELLDFAVDQHASWAFQVICSSGGTDHLLRGARRTFPIIKRRKRSISRGKLPAQHRVAYHCSGKKTTSPQTGTEAKSISSRTGYPRTHTPL